VTELRLIRCTDCELQYEVTYVADDGGPPINCCPRCGSNDLEMPDGIGDKGEPSSVMVVEDDREYFLQKAEYDKALKSLLHRFPSMPGSCSGKGEG
jgi:hypothetical protein